MPWLHSTASDRVMFLGCFNGTFISNQMAIAYLPTKPFDEPDVGRHPPMFGSGGFTAGAPLSTHRDFGHGFRIVKENKKRHKFQIRIKINKIFRKRK